MSFQKIETAIDTAKQLTHWNSFLIEYNHQKILMNTSVIILILHPLSYLTILLPPCVMLS